MELVKIVYEITKSFPDEEKFGLVTQMRRAAVSIPSNIAEGHSRTSTKEFMHFISVALGSTAELETQILLSENLGYIKIDPKETLIQPVDVIGKMLRGLYKSLKTNLGL